MINKMPITLLTDQQYLMPPFIGANISITAAQSTTSGTPYSVQWDQNSTVKEFVLGMTLQSTNTQLRADYAGTYHYGVTICMTNTESTVYVYLNGNIIQQSTQANYYGTRGPFIYLSGTTSMAVNDYLEVKVLQNSGSPNDIRYSSNNFTSFYVYKL